MEKKCTGCKENKSITDFVKMGMTRHSMCDPCRKVYQKKHNDKVRELKKQKLINAW